MLVFGSEYRTANGLVKPGISAHKLLLGGQLGDRRRPRRPALQPGARGQHRRRHRRGRPGRPRRRRRASPAPSAPASPSMARARSTCWSSARAKRRRRAKSSSAPPATTRSRRRTTRCWSIPRGVALNFAAPRRRPASRARRLVPLDDQDHGRDLRVAAVDPLRAPRPRHDSVSWPATMSASVCTGESELMTIVAGPRWARRPSVAASSTVAVTSVAEPLGVRPALAEGQVLDRELRPLEDPQPARRRGSTCGRRAGSGDRRARGRGRCGPAPPRSG